MGLTEYKKMRRFGETPEPTGSVKKASSPAGGKKLEFVVQKHHATRLHYDFRLELDGVLKSWAVPKGPSMNPAEKRLAMMVEDHPFEYRKFEGVIPEGNYGAGKVIIWDRGWYTPAEMLPDKSLKEYKDKDVEKYAQAMLEKGDFKFILHGKKLKGAFVLVRAKSFGENNWLLIKKDDKYVSKKDVTKDTKSVVSGKDVEEIDGQNRS